MDEDIETLIITIRADTQAFAADATTMQTALQGSLGSGVDKAATLIESGLARAIRSGKLGFDDLEKAALAALSQIAASAVSSGISALFDGTTGVLGTIGKSLSASGLVNALLGLPGRATGGPVSPGRAYAVGERGPELFVPTAAGAILPSGPASSTRDVRVAITLNAPADTAPQALARSSRQVARAVVQALSQAER